MEEILSKVINVPSGYIWTYLVYILIGLGLYFTFKLKFVQFRFFIEMFRIVGEKKEKGKGVSSLQAFFISAASRVGTGILPVWRLLLQQGAGSGFWMWIVALVGMASSFVESTLAQVYKVKDGDHFRGGPAYYMEKALGARWLGIIFAVLITITFGLIFNAVQANTIVGSMEGAFNFDKTIVELF